MGGVVALCLMAVLFAYLWYLDCKQEKKRWGNGPMRERRD